VGIMALLEIRSVSKTFGGLTAIDKVDVTIEEGEIVGLIGPNGAGKTTLFNLISGVYRPDAGQIHFDNTDITRLPQHRVIRLGIGRTFQIVQSFENRSVFFIATLASLPAAGSIGEAKKHAEETLKFVGLWQKRNQLGAELTLADRKRLEIAKALAGNPRLLLLDEVMAGLTATEAKAAVELIEEIRKRAITIFLIEHVMQVVMRISQRVAILHYGRKIAEGSPEAVAKDSAVIEAYLGEEYSFGAAGD
jgi:branched-chain amino acid transport system ATP-binding protein